MDSLRLRARLTRPRRYKRTGQDDVPELRRYVQRRRLRAQPRSIISRAALMVIWTFFADEMMSDDDLSSRGRYSYPISGYGSCEKHSTQSAALAASGSCPSRCCKRHRTSSSSRLLIRNWEDVYTISIISTRTRGLRPLNEGI